MTAKKKLGIGLDVLLTASRGQYDIKLEGNILTQAKELFGRALEQDEMGNSFEAYYLYRQVIDLPDISDSNVPEELSELLSRSLNNIAVILADNSRKEGALIYFQQAIDIYPKNRTAIENKRLLKLEIED